MNFNIFVDIFINLIYNMFNNKTSGISKGSWIYTTALGYFPYDLNQQAVTLLVFSSDNENKGQNLL